MTFDGGGNQIPTLGAARAINARGHEVTFLGQRSLARRVEGGGCAFLPYACVPEWTPGLAAEDERDQFFRLLFGSEVADETRGAIERVRPDALVVDCLLAGALAAAERSGLPAAALFHLLYQPFVEGGFARQWSAWMPTINETRRLVGLAPVESAVDLFAPMTLVLVATIERFDFTAATLAANVRYVGPVFDDDPRASAPDLPDDQRPLVLVSASTTYQHQEGALQRAADALGELPVRGLITLGDVLAPEVLSAPENVLVRRYLSHAAVLPQVALVLCHGGLGTVMAALRHGVPLVCLPMGRDQDNNAQRVAALGAGRTLAADARPGEIRDAVAEVLGTSSYHDAAGDLQATIAATGGAARAADELESLVRANG